VQQQLTFKYDVLGNRLEKDVWTIQTGTTSVQRYAYSPPGSRSSPPAAGNAWADLSASNALVTRRFYLDGMDQLAGRIDATGDEAWYLTDRQGSVIGLADNGGNVLDQRTYDAFGNITSETNPSAGDRYGFTGRELDKETSDQYNRGRDLKTQDAYFMQEDPAGFGGGYSNLHVYVGNNATNLTDPTGLWSEEGVIKAFTEQHGDDEKLMKTMLAVLSTYKLEQWTETSVDAWKVDHENRTIYIGQNSFGFWTRSDSRAAVNLYEILSDEFYPIFGLPERWGHIGKRIGGGIANLAIGGLEAVGAASLALAPEPTGLTKVGAVGAGAVAGNTIVQGATQLFRREGGIDLIDEAAGAYGRVMNGAEGEASARYWIGWSQFFFGAAGAAGTTKLGSLPLRELPSATKQALKNAFVAMREKFAQAANSQTITRSIGDLRAAGLKDAHHVIQDAAVRDLPGYDTNAAPGLHLEGPSTAAGTPHYNATQIQRLPGGGTYGAEREIAYDALRAAGYSDAEAAQAIKEADRYFNSIGVTNDTPTRIPGNRR
jgi:RHS repeat-associated protein